MTRRSAPAALALLAVGVASGLVLIDAARRRAEAEDAWATQRAVVRATGLGDPFLSSGSRWLRHPSLSEPGAATSDGPVGIDTDPGGMAIEAFDGAREPGWLVVLPR